MGAHETWNGLNLHWNKVNHILTLDTDILTRQTVEMLLHLKSREIITRVPLWEVKVTITSVMVNNNMSIRKTHKTLDQ